MSLGKSFVAPVASAAVTGAVAAAWGLGNRYFRRLRIAPKSGRGPGERMRRRGHYRVETYTTTTTGHRYMATFGQGSDAYNGTAVLLGESCLALALDRDRLSGLRGVLTPAAAMGDALLARLPAAGVSMGTTRLN
jgi:trans-enoyl reductase